jgi:hypothetical protein
MRNRPVLLVMRSSLRSILLFLILVAVMDASRAEADEVTVASTITQSTYQGTGSAVNNTSLNNIICAELK